MQALLSRRSVLFVVLACSGYSTLSSARETWTAEAPPVERGLQWWLDASQQAAARKAEAQPPLVDEQKVDVLFDGSGAKRHVRQGHAEQQPVWRTAGERAVVRFDGLDDYLRAGDQDLRIKSATVFIMAIPHRNPGGFRALLAGAATGRQDYETGFTIDLSHAGTVDFSTLNVEGAGFIGAQDLLDESLPLGEPHLLEIAIDGDARTVTVRLDGRQQGRRPFEPTELVAQLLTVGARYYLNDVRGYFSGDVAELLLYDRALPREEATAVREYLQHKYASLAEQLPSIESDRNREILRPIPDPPPVQLLTPGFSVVRLPLDVTNVNNVRYRRDGALVLLTYDGRVLVARDTNGDGCEDALKVYWNEPGSLRAPIGMALTPPGYAHGSGVLVAAKGRCVLLVDDDADDEADRLVTVAEGWDELPHGVDALGVAIDPRDHAIFFGLGAADFTNAYQLDASGKSHYRLSSERGTILRVTPDMKRREIFSTGIRFPVGLDFSPQGDLFCTDQEGATWLPNGNPLDELLHIEPGRHYGFPPRHPVHLPDVIDEPSVFDYGPQHQSTCGLHFNVTDHGDWFGPLAWRGDALVAGYSRGKLYRTQLVKTSAGYVARTAVLAGLQELTADACPGPRGTLVIATHSGGPDWGSGPQGPGKLWKVFTDDWGPAADAQLQVLPADAPQERSAQREQTAPPQDALLQQVSSRLARPVMAWSSSPREVRIAFDQPLPAEAVGALRTIRSLQFGPHVRSGDRLENLRPGYEIVARQQQMLRRVAAVFSVGVTPDQRTVVLATESLREQAHYLISADDWPRHAPSRTGQPTTEEQGTAQRPPAATAIPQRQLWELDFQLCGVLATWATDPAQGGENSSVWLPHWGTDVSRALTRGSADHDRFWEELGARDGALTLETRVDLRNLLRPEVQPGSKLDYALPAEAPRLVFQASAPFQVALTSADSPADSSGEPLRVDAQRDGEHYTATVALDTAPQRPLGVKLHFPSARGLTLESHWFTAEDARPRALSLARLHLPWAENEPPRAGEESEPERMAKVLGGNWQRGRALFLDANVGCAKCHRVGARGSDLGPNLSNLWHRDHGSVLRDIVQPSYAINPDFLPQTIQLVDGRVLSGVVRTVDGRWHVADSQGQLTVVAPEEVEAVVAGRQSIMPTGLLDKLDDQQRRDLLVFLLSPPPSMPEYAALTPPPPRRLAELEAVLQQTSGDAAASLPNGSARRTWNVLLVGGPKDHGPGEHDYPAWLRMWSELMTAADGITVEAVADWPAPEVWQRADVAVLYHHGTWDARRAADIDALLDRGAGLVLIHFAVDGGGQPDEFARRIGLAWQGGHSRFRHGALELRLLAAAAGHAAERQAQQNADAHALLSGFSSELKLLDESYWQLIGDPRSVTVLAVGEEDGSEQPLFWAKRHGRGRVFVSIPGHYSWTFDDPLYRVLMLRAIAWSAGEPQLDRFAPLAELGSRLTD